MRLIYAAIVLCCLALLGYALYTQYYDGLIPCALCMTQRGFYGLIAISAFVALIHNPGKVGRWVYSVLMLLAAGGGVATAGRQVWLQNLPEDQVPACGPGVEYLFQAFPFWQALEKLFMGDGNCAEVQWTFLGMSMPTWSLIWFVVLGGVAVWTAFAKRPA